MAAEPDAFRVADPLPSERGDLAPEPATQRWIAISPHRRSAL